VYKDYSHGEVVQSGLNIGPRSSAIPQIIRLRRSMVLQITPIRACNLRCTHCFITNEHKAITDIMSDELFEQSLEVGFGFAEQHDLVDVETVIMGGEIHTMPIEVQRRMYRRAIDRKIKLINDSVNRTDGMPMRKMTLNLITNLIGISEEKLNVFVEASDYAKTRMADLPDNTEFDFLIATSYEPDTNRFHKPHIIDQWKNNIRYLQDRGAPVGVALTGTKGTVEMGAHKLIEMIYHELGCLIMYDHFGAYGEGARNANTLNPEYDDLCAFMIDLVETGRELAEKAGVEEVVAPSIFRGKPMEQLNSRMMCILAIDYDGSVIMDSESSADLQYNKEATIRVGEVGTSETVARLMHHQKRRLLAEFRELLKSPFGCMNCEHVTECQGGFAHFVKLFNKPGQCPGLKPMLDRIMDAPPKYATIT